MSCRGLKGNSIWTLCCAVQYSRHQSHGATEHLTCVRERLDVLPLWNTIRKTQNKKYKHWFSLIVLNSIKCWNDILDMPGEMKWILEMHLAVSSSFINVTSRKFKITYVTQMYGVHISFEQCCSWEKCFQSFVSSGVAIHMYPIPT